MIRYFSASPAFNDNYGSADRPITVTVSGSPRPADEPLEQVTPVTIRSDQKTDAAAPTDSVQRVVLEDGTVEIRYPDGTRRRLLPNGDTEVVLPGGQVTKVSPIQAAPATPPALPAEASVKTWIERHNDDLLDTIKKLLGGDQTSLGNYLDSEKGLSMYQQVNKRIRCIFYLIAPE
jgi:hypothetical protein